MKQLHSEWPIQTIVVTIALLAAGCLSQGALADAQKGNGPGWYISGSAPPGAVALPRHILFEGRHATEADCVALYDRTYSPIGMCRLLATKPGKLAFLYTFVWLDVVFAI